ncbi:MAG: hypothetical protein KF729_35635 [Sandaracinaceae bacterium]|nr:hypothetical protein [Sandaracinaceae bacterium]
MTSGRLFVFLWASLALVPGCRVGGDGSDEDAGDAANRDSDGDYISDADEGRAERRDTDGDGTPDYLDLDSDGDGIPDADEAGDMLLSTPPRDADSDGQPDYVDLDADGNGILDADEGIGDADLDGVPDYADLDDDDDRLSDRQELRGVIDPPIDSDGDGFPNFRDADSDDDLILDGDDGLADTDGDGLLDVEDLDSDNDTIPDRVEAGDDDLYSPPVDSDLDGIPDFQDTDSDNDGLSDRLEERLGTDRTRADSDGDGVTDLIEVAAGTNPRDATDSPLARGDFVFVVDYEQPPMPDRDTLSFRTSIQFADIYFLFDQSGSMGGELMGLAREVTTVLDNLTCADSGRACRSGADCGVGQVCSLTGTCIEDPSTSSCVASAWTGVGYYENAYTNSLSVQADARATATALAAVPLFGGTERLFGAVWAAVEPGVSPVLATSCLPATPGRLGCPGFREEAVRILVTFTDEDSDGAETVEQAAEALIRTDTTFIGVWSGTPASAERQALVNLAQASGSLDRAGQPLVFNADTTGAGIERVVTTAINEIVEGVPLRVTIRATDEPEDAGDALQFIDYLEINRSGGRCSAVSPIEDTDGDDRPDAFPSLLPGTPVCWDVVPRRNTTVPRVVDEPQVFVARLTVYGDESPLDARRVYFLVPPDVAGPGGPD